MAMAAPAVAQEDAPPDMTAAGKTAYPSPGASYTVHDHETKGKNWHVEVAIVKDRKLVAETIVAYEQACNATAFVNKFKMDLKGRINFDDREFDLPKKAKGKWSMHARFTSAHEFAGTYRIVTPTCDTGDRVFRAHAGGHEHGGSNHHSGTRPGEYPALASASTDARDQARDLWRGTLRAAEQLFPFYESALALKFRRYPLKWKKPLLFHLRRDAYAQDKVILDPNRPESLVYWWPKKGDPSLLGFMYRAPLKKTPAFAGRLLAWHSHIEDGRQGDNQMTHVWLTGDLRSALANCLPVDELEQRIPGFKYTRPAHGAGHESRRCRG
jgi:hypothetical protein